MDCVKKIENLLNELKSNSDKEPIRIIVLQRGWVIIGRFSQEGTTCYIKNGFVIRQWGTTEGLGQLAIQGKQPDTVLDPIPTASFHELTIVMQLTCDESKWVNDIN